MKLIDYFKTRKLLRIASQIQLSDDYVKGSIAAMGWDRAEMTHMDIAQWRSTLKVFEAAALIEQSAFNSKNTDTRLSPYFEEKVQQERATE